MLRDNLKVDDEKNKKKKNRSVHLTDTEWTALTGAAERRGISASQLVALWTFNRAAKPAARGVPDRLIQELQCAIRQNEDVHLAFNNGITPIPTALASALWANTVALNALLERLGKC